MIHRTIESVVIRSIQDVTVRVLEPLSLDLCANRRRVGALLRDSPRFRDTQLAKSLPSPEYLGEAFGETLNNPRWRIGVFLLHERSACQEEHCESKTPSRLQADAPALYFPWYHFILSQIGTFVFDSYVPLFEFTGNFVANKVFFR